MAINAFNLNLKEHFGTTSLLHFYEICLSETQHNINVIVPKEIILLSIINHKNIIGFS